MVSNNTVSNNIDATPQHSFESAKQNDPSLKLNENLDIILRITKRSKNIKNLDKDDREAISSVLKIFKEQGINAIQNGSISEIKNINSALNKLESNSFDNSSKIIKFINNIFKRVIGTKKEEKKLKQQINDTTNKLSELKKNEMKTVQEKNRIIIEEAKEKTSMLEEDLENIENDIKKGKSKIELMSEQIEYLKERIAISNRIKEKNEENKKTDQTIVELEDAIRIFFNETEIGKSVETQAIPGIEDFNLEIANLKKQIKIIENNNKELQKLSKAKSEEIEKTKDFKLHTMSFKSVPFYF